jgi:hypothetical protein
MVLDAVARRWSETPDEHLLTMLLRVTDAGRADGPDPLAHVSDQELVAALARGWDDVSRSMPLAQRERPSRQRVVAAIAARWREAPDMRLGQVLVNVVRDYRPDVSPHPLFGLPDGGLLKSLGPATEEERRYVDDEPAAARRGWREWSRAHRLP